MTILEKFEEWKYLYPSLSVGKPAPVEVLKSTEEKIGPLWELKNLLAISNGLTYGRFSVLPIEDPRNIKRTWNSIERNSRFNRVESEFILFAIIGKNEYGYISRKDGSIWFDEDPAHLSEIKGGLMAFISSCLRDEDESST